MRDYKVSGVQTCALPISMIAAMIDGVWLRAALSEWQEADSESARALLTAFVEGRLKELSQAATPRGTGDRKSTRLNSSHLVISYAVFCLKKKKTKASNMK